MEKLAEHKVFDGRQLQYQHRSMALDCDMQFSIYLPELASTTAVPILYWLSGLTCSDQNFVQKAGAQRYAAEYGVALVCPDTSPRGEHVPDDPAGGWDFGHGAGFYVNATQAPWAAHYQMYDYVLNELPQLLQANFNLDTQRTGIAGHSMGGHGALTIALNNPQRYTSVSAFAPIVSPINCPWGNKALGHYLGQDKSRWLRYDTCALLAQATTQLPILVDQGLADEFLVEQLKTELLVEASKQARYPMQIRYQPGYDHSYFFIASFIEQHIAFHAGHW